MKPGPGTPYKYLSICYHLCPMKTDLSLRRPENHGVGWIVIAGPHDQPELRQKVNKGLDGFVGDYGVRSFCCTMSGLGFGLRKPDAPLPMTTWSFTASDRGVCFLEGVLYDTYESHPVDAGEDSKLATLVLDAFLRHGAKAVSGLSGSFAGCVFEPDTGALHTFVDRCGTKPLYWSRHLDALVVASNLAVFRALKASSIDPVAASQYATIRFPVGDPALLGDVRVQAPRTINTFRGKSHRSARYWEIPRRAENVALRDSDELISQSIEDCVDRLAARAKQPVGLGLTNGHDSRVIFSALLHRKVPFEV